MECVTAMKLGLFLMSKLGAKCFLLKESVDLMKFKMWFWSSSFQGESQRLIKPLLASCSWRFLCPKVMVLGCHLNSH